MQLISYFEKMQQLAVEAGTLVIAKESSGNVLHCNICLRNINIMRIVVDVF